MEIVKNKQMYERILQKMESNRIKDSISKMENDIDSYVSKFKIIEDTVNNMKVIFNSENEYNFEDYCSDFDPIDYDFDEIVDFSEDVIGSLEIKSDGLKKLITDMNSRLNTAQEEKEMIEFVKNIISDLDSKLHDEDSYNTSSVYDV
jgi:hypothetical protein